MVFIVRRTLQTGKCATTLERRILAEARRLDAQRHDLASHDPDQRIRAVADALCNAVLKNLHPVVSNARHAHETVAELAQTAC